MYYSYNYLLLFIFSPTIPILVTPSFLITVLYRFTNNDLLVSEIAYDPPPLVNMVPLAWRSETVLRNGPANLH